MEQFQLARQRPQIFLRLEHIGNLPRWVHSRCRHGMAHWRDGMATFALLLCQPVLNASFVGQAPTEGGQTGVAASSSRQVRLPQVISGDHRVDLCYACCLCLMMQYSRLCSASLQGLYVCLCMCVSVAGTGAHHAACVSTSQPMRLPCRGRANAQCAFHLIPTCHFLSYRLVTCFSSVEDFAPHPPGLSAPGG